MQKQYSNTSQGFTLVELAIVLVVIGLIVSAALGGREILRIAKLKSAISEVQGYQVAVDNFKEAYNGLPGDLKNATSFWTSGTANGNGDGHIGDGTAGDDTEPYYAWDQLALAKLIPGVYSGAGTAAAVGVNVPRSSAIENSGYSLSYFSTSFGYTDTLGRAFPGHYLALGRNHTTHNYVANASLAPEEAVYIDNKMDDGTPDFGKVLGVTGLVAPVGACTTGSAPNLTYDMANAGVACTLYFLGENQ